MGHTCHIRCSCNASEDESPQYLQKSEAVDFSLFDILEMSEQEAEARFEAIRFARTGGEPACVWCPSTAVTRITRNVSNRKTGIVTQRRLFACKLCLKQFSVTSQTEFHGRKLSFRKIMAAVLLFANGAAGTAALRLRRDIKCNHKTAWLLEQRLRHSMETYLTSRRVNGLVEMDSTTIGGKIRPANEASARKSQPRRNMKKAVDLSVLRERAPGGFVVPFLGDESAVARSIGLLAEPDTHFIVDEHKAWNIVASQYNMRRIKHKERYSDYRGTSTNQAESYFSRFKQMYRGTYRYFWGRYAQSYNVECAWREEHRRHTNGEQFILVLAGALHHPPSPHWRGYYQRTRRKAAA